MATCAAIALHLWGGVREVRINLSLGFASREMLGELATLNIPILRVQAGIDGEHAHDFLRFPGAMDATLAAFRMLGSLGVDRLWRASLCLGAVRGRRAIAESRGLARDRRGLRVPRSCARED